MHEVDGVRLGAVVARVRAGETAETKSATRIHRDDERVVGRVGEAGDAPREALALTGVTAVDAVADSYNALLKSAVDRGAVIRDARRA